MMRLFVCYDARGRIGAAMRVRALDPALEHPFGHVEEGEQVLEVAPETSRDADAIDLHDIGQHFTVDPAVKKLRPARAPAPESDPPSGSRGSGRPKKGQRHG
jgi:hypothetical protein